MPIPDPMSVALVWADGSCDANGQEAGRGGWAALIQQEGTVCELSGSASDTTRARMVLTAICEALETLTGAIEVRTDSTYLERRIKVRWLRDGVNGSVENRDLWERLFALVRDEQREVTFRWLRDTAGDPYDERVDLLARAAALSR